MTDIDIIAMAREIGEDWWFDDLDLERFAALVAAAAKAEEREACAKVCDELAEAEKPSELWTTYMGVAYKQAATAIRARGETK